MSFEIPQAEEVDDLLLSCRYGDLEDVREFVSKFGINELVKARDERGNCALHMCCANGHDGMFDSLYIFSFFLPSKQHIRKEIVYAYNLNDYPDTLHHTYLCLKVYGLR